MAMLMHVGVHLQVRMPLLGCRISNELAGDLAAGPNEAHDVGMERQLALQVHLLLEQLQRSCVQPCMTSQLCSQSLHLRWHGTGNSCSFQVFSPA